VGYNKTFRSYGPRHCFPSFNTTMQHRAFTRRASCENSAPFSINETYRVALATASTGSALNPAYELAIHSHMTYSTIHNTSVHMLCADLVPGIWNKIAFLASIVINELLKPQSERLEWILWIDRDTLILDQCRPLSSFLPPKTSAFNKVNLIACHDAFGLNAGVFFFRPNRWVLQFFNAVLAYPHYKPNDHLVFAEQSAMDRILSSTTDEEDYSEHFARVPWYWFNAYPPEGNTSTRSFVEGIVPDGYEWFRPRQGDFLAHFAGHPGRDDEIVEWGKALEEVGDVWEGTGAEAKRDVSRDVRNYW
ncbi:glycosyltransferase family 34 protein, partial [Plenodomus tracheiphilus IPT5]